MEQNKPRLLFIPLDWGRGAQPDFYESLCNEFQVWRYDGDDADAVMFCPEYIYVQCGALNPHKLTKIKQISQSKVIQWTGNCNGAILDEVLIYKDIADLTLLASGIGQKKEYEAVLGHPVDYLQHGMAKFNFKPVKRDLTEKKVVFIGNAYGHFEGAVERNNLCQLLSQKFSEFEVIGNGFADGNYNNSRSCSYYDTPDIYNNSYIGISANCMNDIEGYWSNRPLDIMAAGCCCLMRYTPKAEKWFKDWVNVVFYNTNEEAVSHISTLLQFPETRNGIAKNGQELIRSFHTLDYRAKELKQLINLHLSL